MKREEWAEIAEKTWIRRRWRSINTEQDHCFVCEAPFNRPDTYYVRPAYTDGSRWMCASCFDEMTDALGDGLDHRYGRRRNA